jgi:hypothetical protein
LPGQQSGAFLGVAVAPTQSEGAASPVLEAVLLTQEGFTLLEARAFDDESVVVTRAIPPLDRPGFAQAMVSDIAFLLFEPPGSLSVGRSESGARACRWTLPDAAYVQASFDGHDRTELERVSKKGTATRVAQLWQRNSLRFAKTMHLEAPGLTGYSLDLELLEAEVGPSAAEPRVASMRASGGSTKKEPTSE